MDLNNRKMTNHPSSQFVNTIQSHLFIECIQDQFRFLKDCTSLVKGIGLLVHNYFSFFGPNTQCALVVALWAKRKYHSV